MRRHVRASVPILVLGAILSLTAGACPVAAGPPASRSPDAGQPSPSVAPPAPSLTPGPDREPALAPTEVFGYLPSWELDDGDPIDLGQLTTLAWFGVEAGPDGHIVRVRDGVPSQGWQGWTGEVFGALAGEAQAAGARVVLAVERFAWTAEDEAATIALLSDPGARATLVADVIAAVRERGADGAHLDVEPLPSVVRDDLTALVRELRAAMNAVDPALQLTVAVTPDVSAYDLAALVARDAADALVLLGYEYRTPGAKRSGSIAPLADPAGSDLRESVRAALREVPPDRLVLALPWYGRAWSTRDAQPGSRTRTGDRYLDPSTVNYDVAVARAEVAGRRYDRRQASAWSVYPGTACETCPVAPRQLWYDDVDAFGDKVAFALREGLRGVGIWALGYQGARPELWSALAVARGVTEDSTAPRGTATLSPGSTIEVRAGVPVVGDVVGVDLVADDGTDGTGVAFVRVSTGRRVNASGELREGVTIPATDHLELRVSTGTLVQEVLRPSAPDPTPVPGSPGPSLAPSPRASPRLTPRAAPTARTLSFQWRDVAGNWSKPIGLRVLLRPGAG
jgi:spore germination protein YaaH